MELLKFMLFCAYQFKLSFKTIFHFLATSCVLHNVLLDEIRIQNTPGGPQVFSLRDIAIADAEKIIKEAGERHPNLIIRNITAQPPAASLAPSASSSSMDESGDRASKDQKDQKSSSNLSLQPSAQPLMFNSPLTSSSKTAEAKIFCWSDLTHEEILIRLKDFAEKARSNSKGYSEAKKNCPYLADFAIRFLRTGKQPNYKPVVIPNSLGRDYRTSLQYVNEVVFNRKKVLRVRQVMEATVKVPLNSKDKNSRIRELPSGSNVFENKEQSTPVKARICHLRRVEFFGLEQRLIEEAKAHGGTIMGRLDFFCAGDDPGPGHNIAFLATKTKTGEYKVYYIDLHSISNSNNRNNSNPHRKKEAIFSRINCPEEQEGYYFVKSQQDFIDGDFGMFVFYDIVHSSTPRLQLQPVASAPAAQQLSDSNSQSSSSSSKDNAMTLAYGPG